MTDGTPVTLEQLLDAREARAARQQELLAKHGGALVCLTVNMPGPVKRCVLSDRLFTLGARAVSQVLGGVRFSELRQTPAGCEGFWCVSGSPLAVKRALCRLEEDHPLGRLWDIDVLGPDGVPVSRRALGLPPRRCLLCSLPAVLCARSGAHPLSELLCAMRQMLTRWESARIGALARRALEDEVRVTPKPGLVDAVSNGAHTDMDIGTFLASAQALEKHFARFTTIGMDSGGLTPRALFDSLRRPGMDAEQDMLAATGGINTHKGAIFSLGILCAAAGRQVSLGGALTADALCGLSADMTRGLCARELPCEITTHGGQVFQRFGARGVRGEAESGFASVRTVGLPTLRQYRHQGTNEACVRVLLRLMACVEDTNLLARRGPEQAAWVREQAQALTDSFSVSSAAALDTEMTRRGLSPGGCADLLAVTIFLDALERAEQ